MRINTNINSMRTQEYMRQNQDKMNTAMNRLSSGKSINSAADDAAGLAIATRMRAKEGGLNVGARNTQDAMSALRTGDAFGDLFLTSYFVCVTLLHRLLTVRITLKILLL